MHNIHPDKEKTMFKKAYSLTERVVEELVNDPELYPDNGINVGFDNVGQVRYNGVTYGAGSSTLSEQEVLEAFNADCGAYEEGSDERDSCQLNKASAIRDLKNARIKFCRLFAMKLNTLESDNDDTHTITTNCENAARAGLEPNTTDDDNSQWNNNTNNAFGSRGTNSFTTTDGMIWRMPYTNFTELRQDGSGADPSLATIWIDVNGEKAPNQADTDLTVNANATCDHDANIDRFSITVRADGKMTVNGACAREYVSDMTLMHK